MGKDMDCGFLGEPTGETLLCSTCKGTVHLKVFHCSHPAHDNVTVRDCEACPDYITKEALALVRASQEPPLV